MRLGEVITKYSGKMELTFLTHLDAIRSIGSHRPHDSSRFIASIQNIARSFTNSNNASWTEPEVDGEVEERCRPQFRQE